MLGVQTLGIYLQEYVHDNILRKLSRPIRQQKCVACFLKAIVFRYVCAHIHGCSADLGSVGKYL
jgi:hypothetical protein